MTIRSIPTVSLILAVLTIGLPACQAAGAPPRPAASTNDPGPSATPTVPAPTGRPTASPTDSQTGPASALPAVSQDPRQAAEDYLRLTKGATCQGSTSADLDPALLKFDGSVTGWIRNRDVWVGDLASAVKAYGGTLVARGADDVWLYNESRDPDWPDVPDGRGAIERVLAVATPQGRTAWLKTGDAVWVAVDCDKVSQAPG